MAAPIKDTVRVNITNDTLRLAEKGFGTTLLITGYSHMEDRCKVYSEPAEMLADGFLTTDEAYKKALVLMGQARTPLHFMVGRYLQAVNAKQVIKFSDTPASGTFKLGVGKNMTGDIAYDATTSAIQTALQNLTEITSVTVVRPNLATIEVEFTGTDGKKAWELLTTDVTSLGPSLTAVVEHEVYGSAKEDILDCWNAIKNENDDFYSVITTSDVTDTDALDLAEVVETDVKFFMYLTHEDDVVNSSYNESAPADLPSKLKNLSLTKTAVVYSSSSVVGKYIDAAIIGLQLTKVPGSSTFMYKNLVNTSPATLTTQQRNNLRSKNCNFYESQGGRAIFKDGKVGSGEWIDIIIGIDYLSTRMSEVVYGGISIVEKVDFDENGGMIIESLIFTALVNYGVNNNFIIDESIVIIIPDVTTIPAQEKADRILKNVKFRAKLKGAIHIVEIDGSLSV